VKESAVSRLVGRAILPADPVSAGLAAWKGGCGQDWPPHRILFTDPDVAAR